MPNTFGERLRELRNGKNLLQSEFGSLFGLSPSAIGSYERNEREPAYHQLVEFADYFNVSLDYLLCRSDEKMTVQDYILKDSFQLQEVFDQYAILIGSYELNDDDKKRILDISCGLLFGFDQSKLP